MDEILASHRAFWSGAAASPLVARLPARRWEPRPYPASGGRWFHDPTLLGPADVDVDRLLGLDRPAAPLVCGDLLMPVGCVYPEAWMEALIGCPILASAYGTVARPAGVDLRTACRRFSVEAALRSPWLDVMDRVVLKARECAKTERPVRQLHQRGIVDMLAAYLGEAQLCTAACDTPDLVGELGSRFAKLHVAVARRGLGLRPRWRGGCVSVWNVYAPGALLDYQIDASSLFSAHLYEGVFAELDAQVLADFPYNVVHLHACGLHMLDAVLGMPAVRAVEINLDRETGVWRKERILDSCRRIQAASRGVIVNGLLSDGELAEFRADLNPGRAAFWNWAEDIRPQPAG